MPPGWDEFDSPAGRQPLREYDYTLNENGTCPITAPRRRDYGTDVYVRPTSFITRASQGGTSRSSPTSPSTRRTSRRPRRRETWARSPEREGAAHARYNEADVERQAAVGPDAPADDTRDASPIDALYRRRLQSLQAVDRGVASLVDTLRRTGQLDNTYIVFTSDNGFHLGQHRLPAGKQTAYDDRHPRAAHRAGAGGSRAGRPHRSSATSTGRRPSPISRA